MAHVITVRFDVPIGNELENEMLNWSFRLDGVFLNDDYFSFDDPDRYTGKFEITVTKTRYLGTVMQAIDRTLKHHGLIDAAHVEKGGKR